MQVPSNLIGGKGANMKFSGKKTQGPPPLMGEKGDNKNTYRWVMGGGSGLLVGEGRGKYEVTFAGGKKTWKKITSGFVKVL
jgi:hypothetical protein